MQLRKKVLPIQISEVNEAEGTIKAVFSSGKKYRNGEIIDQTSWILDEFMQNPVVLFAHQDKEPAVGQVIQLGLNHEGMLEGIIKFAIKEYDFAKTLFNLYAGKFMRAISVGFMPGSEEETDEGILLKDNILYEVSVVNIPADALALAKSKGMDLSRVDGITEKEGRVLSAKNRVIIEKARSALDDVLIADRNSRESNEDKESAKYQQVKKLNQAIRLLLEAKSKSKNR